MIFKKVRSLSGIFDNCNVQSLKEVLMMIIMIFKKSVNGLNLN